MQVRDVYIWVLRTTEEVVSVKIRWCGTKGYSEKKTWWSETGLWLVQGSTRRLLKYYLRKAENFDCRGFAAISPTKDSINCSVNENQRTFKTWTHQQALETIIDRSNMYHSQDISKRWPNILHCTKLNTWLTAISISHTSTSTVLTLLNS